MSILQLEIAKKRVGAATGWLRSAGIVPSLLTHPVCRRAQMKELSDSERRAFMDAAREGVGMHFLALLQQSEQLLGLTKGRML